MDTKKHQDFELRHSDTLPMADTTPSAYEALTADALCKSLNGLWNLIQLLQREGKEMTNDEAIEELVSRAREYRGVFLFDEPNIQISYEKTTIGYRLIVKCGETIRDNYFVLTHPLSCKVVRMSARMPLVSWRATRHFHKGSVEEVMLFREQDRLTVTLGLWKTFNEENEKTYRRLMYLASDTRVSNFSACSYVFGEGDEQPTNTDIIHYLVEGFERTLKR